MAGKAGAKNLEAKNELSNCGPHHDERARDPAERADADLSNHQRVRAAVLESEYARELGLGRLAAARTFGLCPAGRCGGGLLQLSVGQGYCGQRQCDAARAAGRIHEALVRPIVRSCEKYRGSRVTEANDLAAGRENG